MKAIHIALSQVLKMFYLRNTFLRTNISGKVRLMFYFCNILQFSSGLRGCETLTAFLRSRVDPCVDEHGGSDHDVGRSQEENVKEEKLDRIVDQRTGPGSCVSVLSELPVRKSSGFRELFQHLLLLVVELVHPLLDSL